MKSKKFRPSREVVEGILMKMIPFVFLVFILTSLGFCTTPRTSGQYAKINGIRVFYNVYGEGKPILLLHGGLGSSDSFKSPVAYLSKEYFVITPDSRGHGRTSDGDQPISYELMADDMIKLLDHLGIDSVYVISKSDGGNTGLAMAISYPERIRKLVVIGANFRAEGTRKDYMEKLRSMTAKTAWPDVVEDYKRLVPEPDHWPIFFDKIRSMWLSSPNFSLEQLANISVQTMIIAGDRDIIRLDHTIELFESIPKAQLFVVPGTSHYVLEEKPKLVLGFIDNFIKELVPEKDL